MFVMQVQEGTVKRNSVIKRSLRNCCSSFHKCQTLCIGRKETIFRLCFSHRRRKHLLDAAHARLASACLRRVLRARGAGRRSRHVEGRGQHHQYTPPLVRGRHCTGGPAKGPHHAHAIRCIFIDVL